MQRKRNPLVALVVAFGGLAAFTPSAHAVLIAFDPSTINVVSGNTFDVGLRVSGLEDGQDEIVSAFDLDVLFDSSLLTATDFFFGTDLGPIDFLSGFNLSAGLADIFHTSLLFDEELAALQGDSVLIGTLRFLTTDPGQSLLSFGLDTAFGQNLVGRDFTTLPVDAGTGLATIDPPVSVPEPSTFALLSLGLALLPAARRARARL